MVLASESSMERRAKFSRFPERPRAAPLRQATSLQAASFIAYACSPDCDRPGTMPVEILVRAKALKNIRWGMLEPGDVEYLVAERIRPCRNRPFTSHETVDRRAIRLPPATKGRAAAASPDPQAAAPNAGHCQCWRVLRRWRSGRTRALRLEHRQPRVIW